MRYITISFICSFLFLSITGFNAIAQTSISNPHYNAEAAKRTGADENGMRQYVLVILKTGSKRVPAGKERDAMFAGHFANINQLAKEGKLAIAGPFDGKEAWRGLFILAVDNIDEAKKITETDPVITQGEMIAEYHLWYGSAALMEVANIHDTLSKNK